MGINDITGAFAGIWAKAKSAATGNLPAAPPPDPGVTPDSAQLSHKDQYFAGYAQPTSGQTSEPNLWAPLVITPTEGPKS